MTCECYDPVLNKWTYVAPMNVKRSRVALVASGGKLYAIGECFMLGLLSQASTLYAQENK